MPGTWGGRGVCGRSVFGGSTSVRNWKVGTHDGTSTVVRAAVRLRQVLLRFGRDGDVGRNRLGGGGLQRNFGTVRRAGGDVAGVGRGPPRRGGGSADRKGGWTQLS